MLSYKPLFHLLVDRGMSREKLRQKIGASMTTMAKFSKGENVSLDVICRICAVLDCKIQDVVEYIPDGQDD